MTALRRWKAVGGVLGPASFVTAWCVLGARQAGYSAVQEPISRLAAHGAPTRPAMTAGFLAFGVGVALYAPELRRAIPGGAALAAATTAAATACIALFPLDARYGDGPHAVAAGIAYTGLAATPILAARSFVVAGHRTPAVLSAACGVTVGASLLGSILTQSATGLFQRAGLTLGDIWIATTAMWLLTRRSSL